VSVTIRDARNSPADREWISRAFRGYLDDLSAGGTGVFPALTEAGLSEPDQVLDWFRDERSRPLVLLSGGQPVGFARILTGHAPLPASGPPGFRLTDFFVQARHRGRGVGRHAAALIFARFEGQWLVTEETRNPGAVKFWRRVVAEFTGGRYTERVAGAEVRHTFVSQGAAHPGSA
jgi:predicted acetyltransferase